MALSFLSRNSFSALARASLASYSSLIFSSQFDFLGPSSLAFFFASSIADGSIIGLIIENLLFYLGSFYLSFSACF